MKNATTASIAAVALAAGLVAVSTGCGGPGDSSSRAAQQTRGTPTVVKSTDRPATPPAVATSAPAYNGDVKDLMIPPGATVVDLEPGRLVLMSSDSVDTLARFYDGALARLGAQSSEAAIVGSDWGYDGTYDVDQSIQIAVVDADGRRDISISY